MLLLGVPEHESGAHESSIPGSGAHESSLKGSGTHESSLSGSGAHENRTPGPGVGHGAHEKEECARGSDVHALQDPALVTYVTLSNLAF